MGLINAEIELSNPADTVVKPIKVKSLVDTGALHLCVPEHIAIQLKLQRVVQAGGDDC